MFSDREKEIFYRIIKSRRSVREFRDREIPDDVLERVLETGRRSASAANRQPWYFVIARKSEGHSLYNLLYGRKFQNAPVIIMGVADRNQAWERKSDQVNYAWVDVTIALTEMILAATAEGLGTCWVAAFDDAEARRILGLREGLDPVSMVVLGYPVDPLVVESKDRKEMPDIIRKGKWKP